MRPWGGGRSGDIPKFGPSWETLAVCLRRVLGVRLRILPRGLPCLSPAPPRRFITDSPLRKDVTPERAKKPGGHVNSALWFEGELCLINHPNSVIFARPETVYYFPDLPAPKKEHPWRKVYANPQAVKRNYEAKYGPA